MVSVVDIDDPRVRLPKEARCASCHAPIWWLRAYEFGQEASIDTIPQVWGNIKVNLVDHTYEVVLNPEQERGLLYTSHLQTCPRKQYLKYNKPGATNTNTGTERSRS